MPYYQQERARLTKAQADHEELRVQEKEDELIPAEAVRQSWLSHVFAARSVLLALPTKIAPVVMAAKTIRDAEEFARDEVYSALEELADIPHQTMLKATRKRVDAALEEHGAM